MTGKQNGHHQRAKQQNAVLTVQVKPSELTSITTVLKSYTDVLQRIPALPQAGHLVTCYLESLRLRCTTHWQRLSPVQRTNDEVFALEVLVHELIALGAAVDFYSYLMRVKAAYQTRHASQTLQRCTDVLERFIQTSAEA